MMPTWRDPRVSLGRKSQTACALTALLTFSPNLLLAVESARESEPQIRDHSSTGGGGAVREGEAPGGLQANPLGRAHNLSYIESPDRAIAEYERVLAGNPTPRVAQEAQLGIAALEYAKGDYRRARETVRDVLLQRPDWDLVKYGTYQLKEIDRRIAWASSPEARMAECGVRSLHEVLRTRGLEASVREVASRVDGADGMSSLADLRNAAAAFDLRAVAAQATPDDLEALPKPLIAHLRPNHFVVVARDDGGGYRVIDPDLPGGVLPEERFRERWSGAVLLFPAEGASLDAVDLLKEAETGAVRGGHHLHGNHLGDSCSNPASAFHGGPSSPNPGCTGGALCSQPGLPTLSVNLANFNLLVQDLDFAYRGLGPSVLLQRTYNADDPDEGVFGRSWSFNYGVAVEEQPGGSVNLRRESGKEEFFSLLGCSGGTCTYRPPVWIHDELRKLPDGTFELRVKRTRLLQRFDPGGRLIAIEDRNGNAVALGYDAGGRLSTVTDAAGRVSTFAYGAEGRVSRVTDPSGREVTFAYDAARNLVESVDMAGNLVSYTYDANSYMSSVTTPTGTWTITNVPYDDPAFGLVVESITDPLGHTTRYSTPGLVVVEVEDPNGIVWQYFPVNNGELASITDPLGNSTQFQYSSRGDLTRVTDPLGNATSFSWDSRGNLTRITDPLGHRLDLAYDADDDLTQLVDPLGNTYGYLYDAQGNLIQITDAAGGVAVFSYDGLGQPVAFSDARGKTTLLSYDAQGNLESTTTPLGKQTLYSHDAIGRPTSVTTPRGVTRSFEWDGIDRLTKVTYPDASEVSLTYGCCQLQSVSGPNGTLSFAYDGAGRPASYTDVWGHTIGYGLDPGGRLTSLTYPDGKVVGYTHDDAGRLIRVTDWLGGVTSHQYDPIGRLVRTDLTNASVALHAYDAASRLTALTNAAPDGSLISRYQYTYDALGNRTHVEQYEPVPPSIPDETVSYLHDDDNRLIAADTAAYEYDDDGNLISKTEGGQATTFEYDFEGRLVEVAEGAQVTQYLYDAMGTRVGKVQGGAATRHVVNPLAGLSQLLIETDGAGNPTRYYTYGLGLLSMITADGERYSYHYDAIGSAIALTDSNRNLVDKYAYRPFGKLFQESALTLNNSFRFGGRLGVYDEGHSLEMRARWYTPDVARFTADDPLSQNDYVYAANNPITLVDPLGLCPLAALRSEWAAMIRRINRLVEFIGGVAVSAAESLSHRIPIQVTSPTFPAFLGSIPAAVDGLLGIRSRFEMDIDKIYYYNERAIGKSLPPEVLSEFW